MMLGRRIEQNLFLPTASQQEALHRLLYLVETAAPFALLSGPPGSGRSAILTSLRRELQALPIHAVTIDAASLDADGLLWSVVDAMSLGCTFATSRFEQIARLRDELLARARCEMQTVLLIDGLDRPQCVADRHSAAEISLQLLATLARQSAGHMTIVCVADSQTRSQFSGDVTLTVEVNSLTAAESFELLTECMKTLVVEQPRLTTSALAAIIEIAAGNIGRLVRLCRLITVVHATAPQAVITDQTVYAIDRELCGRPAA